MGEDPGDHRGIFDGGDDFQAAAAAELHAGHGAMLDFGIEKLLRDASVFLHMEATADISRLKIVKAMFPRTAGAYSGPESWRRIEPTGNGYGDAAGHVCLAIAGRVERALTLETGHADRVTYMRAFAAAALALLVGSLEKA